jgi:hypothetical protein
MVFGVVELKKPGLELIDHNWSFIMSLMFSSEGPAPWTDDKRQLWNEVKIHIQGYLPYEPGTVSTSTLCLMRSK